MDKRSLAYWIPTALFALAMTGSGAMNLLRPPELLEAMAHLSFPTWFPLWLGSWKLAGVAVLLAPGLPRLKEWATAGFTISLTSAAVAHLATGDALGEAIAPLVMLGLGLTSWWLRPSSRRLADPSPAVAGAPAAA
jgi:hypothetical protein